MWRNGAMEAELNGKERVFHRKLSYVQKVRGILLIQPGNRIQDPETKEPQTLIPNTNILLHQQTLICVVGACIEPAKLRSRTRDFCVSTCALTTGSFFFKAVTITVVYILKCESLQVSNIHLTFIQNSLVSFMK